MPSSLHNNIIEDLLREYREKGWLAFSEVRYGKYIFDIMAFNPETREVEVVEVVVANEVDNEKLKFAEKLGKVRIVRPFEREEEVKMIERERDLGVLGSPIRFKILEALSTRKLNYIKIYDMIGYERKGSKRSGKLAYHLKLLLNAGLIKKEGNMYSITERGIKILYLLKEVE
jgi:DNA-binding transcriptional ArsR family regulator